VSETTKISVLMPSREAERFEAFCEARGHKKSTLIRRLIREHLDREGFAVQVELFSASQRRKPGKDQ
jgi:predicted DNA-binding protein